MGPQPTLNCWEYQGCERQPGGRLESEHGPCPVATAEALHGSNGGINGGRSCWAVDDTLCGGEPSGPQEHKIHECRKCSFRSRVQIEAGLELMPDSELRSRLLVSESK